MKNEGKSRAQHFKKEWRKKGFCCSKEGIVGIFSYIYIDKSGKKVHIFRGRLWKKWEF